MIIKNISTSVLFLKDLKVTHESQSEGRRSEEFYLHPGKEVVLPNTSEVLRSVANGDIAMFVKTGKVVVGKKITVSSGDDVTLTHNLGYVPNVVVGTYDGSGNLVVPSVAEVKHQLVVNNVLNTGNNTMVNTVVISNSSLGDLDLFVNIG